MQTNNENTRIGKLKLAELLNGVNEKLQADFILKAERKDKGYRLKAVAPNSRRNAKGEVLLDEVHPADIGTFAKGMMFSLATMGAKHPTTIITTKRSVGRPKGSHNVNRKIAA